ncbi:hypothetical protein MCOR18_010995, partial [Pyricularia oryzae]
EFSSLSLPPWAALPLAEAASLLSRAILYIPPSTLRLHCLRSDSAFWQREVVFAGSPVLSVRPGPRTSYSPVKRGPGPRPCHGGWLSRHAIPGKIV